MDRSRFVTVPSSMRRLLGAVDHHHHTAPTIYYTYDRHYPENIVVSQVQRRMSYSPFRSRSLPLLNFRSDRWAGPG